MTDFQLKTIDAMKKLGSQGYTKMDGQNVYVSLPFAEDRNPNIKVWPDGSWHDFSGNEEKWANLGLRPFGTLKELTSVLAVRFKKLWLTLPRVTTPEIINYAKNRALYYGYLCEMNGALAFPIYDPDQRIVIGIQTRRVDGGLPKNQMVHGSDGKNGLFIAEFGVDHSTVLVCEGATDSYSKLSEDYDVIGAISCSMLDGVKRFLLLNREKYERIVLAFDADDPGRAAQGEMINYLISVGISKEHISVLVHSNGCKDVNDEVTKHMLPLMYESLPEIDSNIFVRFADAVLPEMEDALWVGFFPPDFPGYDHSTRPDGQHSLYVFPESYPRTDINRQMYNYKSSAYILKGY
jgi:5S rRNA maturation endonuclease (ribonuclease M5)